MPLLEKLSADRESSPLPAAFVKSRRHSGCGLRFDTKLAQGVEPRGMIPLLDLWLPVLLSAVVVFFASFIMHMVLPYHKSDYRKLPDEDRVTDAMRNAGVTRGPAYFFPYFVQGNEIGAGG